MYRKGITLAILLVVASAGCLGVLGIGGPVDVGEERGRNGAIFLYVKSNDGPLPAGTRITVNTTVPGAENVTGTLDRRVPEDERVYLGGTLGGSKVTDFRVGTPPLDSNVPGPLLFEVTVTITVDTGNVTHSETFTYGG